MGNTTRFLVTTAIEETWPCDGSPILFLGEWCKLYSRKSVWDALDHDVHDYHWDDREKLHRDYVYISKLYEDILKALTIQLNQYHKVNYSSRYWRILIGPWLGYFIQILYDRWFSIESVSKSASEKFKYIRLKYEPEKHIPCSMKDFVQFIETDIWNQLIFQELLLNNENFEPENKVISQEDYPLPYVKSSFKETIRLLINKLSCLTFRKGDVFIISSYFKISDLFKLQIKLRQIPSLWCRIRLPSNNKNLDRKDFKKLMIDEKLEQDKFCKLVSKMIPLHIPRYYLEEYENLRKFSAKMYPRAVKKIFDRNSWNSDDVTKIWIAEKVENGCEYVVGQHGGSYGVSLWNFTEDHQLAIATNFISWGWERETNPNVIPLGNMGSKSKITKSSFSSGNAILVEMAVPRFSYHMYSIVVGSTQYNSYFEDQIRFVNSLSTRLQKELLVKLHPQDYQLSQAVRWRDRKPNIRVYNGSQSMLEMLDSSRLIISSYNATTYLETLSRNFPTLMFWNPAHWELRESAKPYFKILEAAGIFHQTPESAARQMELVWDDVAAWWYAPETQDARHQFCENYIKIERNVLERYSSILAKQG